MAIEDSNETQHSSASNEPQRPDDRHIEFWEIAPALEFICWVVVALAPMLRLVNGPPVTRDQAVIQIALVVMAVTGAISLRIYNWRVRDRWKLEHTQDAEDAQ